MFSICWGSIPDWLSAIGSLAAVFAALWLGCLDRKRAIRADAALAESEQIARRHILAWAALAHADSDRIAVALGHPRNENYDVLFDTWVETLGSVHKFCLNLLKAGRLDFDQAAALSDLLEASSLPSDIRRTSWEAMAVEVGERTKIFERIMTKLQLGVQAEDWTAR